MTEESKGTQSTTKDGLGRERTTRGSVVDSTGRNGRSSLQTSRGPLSAFAPREGFVQRWVNNAYTNMDRALDRGWRPRALDGVAPEDVDMQTFGNCITRVVSRDGTKAILMEMPKDVYDSLQAKKMAELDEIEEAMKPAANLGYMKTEVKRS